MNKKKGIIVIIIMLLVFFLSSCSTGYKIINFEASQMVIDKLNYSDSPNVYYFEKATDISNLNNNLLIKYDRKYFSKHALFIVTLIDNINNEYIGNNVLNKHISITRMIENNSEKTKWTFLIEIAYKLDEAEDPNDYVVDFINQKKELHVHNYKETIITPTCINQGYTKHECACGDNYIDSYTDIVECQYKNGKCIWCNKEKTVDSYKISSYGDELSRMIFIRSYKCAYDPYEPCGYVSLTFLEVEKEANKAIYIDMTAEFDDYYTCCYFNKEKLYLLDKVKKYYLEDFKEAYYELPWGAWSGIDCYFALIETYNEMQLGMYNENSKMIMSDIKWYEISKDETIPEEIDNYILIAITESKTIKQTNFYGENETEHKWFFESKHLYNDGFEYPEYDEFYNDWINQRYYMSDNFCSLYRHSDIVVSREGFDLLKHHSLRIETIDGVEYIRSTHYKSTNPKELLENLEYREELTDGFIKYYWFKLDDALKYIYEKLGKEKE